jgi:hypothetical protein
MTLQEALALTAGDEIHTDGQGGIGVPSTVRVTSAFPARPELGLDPAICGKDVDRPNVSLCIVLDGGEECMKALGHWRTSKPNPAFALPFNTAIGLPVVVTRPVNLPYGGAAAGEFATVAERFPETDSLRVFLLGSGVYRTLPADALKPLNPNLLLRATDEVAWVKYPSNHTKCLTRAEFVALYGESFTKEFLEGK